jgi:hypothetical protein
LCLAAAIILLLAYLPGLVGGFVFDDFENVVRLQRLLEPPLTLSSLWSATWSSLSGPLGRPVATFTFALQIAATGLDPRPLILFNLLVHAVTGWLLYLLAARLITLLLGEAHPHRRWIAAACALLWLLHPLQLTSVAYIVQRMNSLAALFTVLTLWIYLRERTAQRGRPGRWYRTLGLMSLTGLLALFSKENALLIPVYLLVMEVFLLRFTASRRADGIAARVLTLGGTALLVVGFLYRYGIDLDGLTGGYAQREFTLPERLLTEGRALAWYLQMLLLPNPLALSLYHDDFTLSSGLLSPPATLAALLLVVGLLLGGLASRRRAPWFGFGVYWFFGGHLLESTIIPLELVYEHRNYLPSFGIVFLVTFSFYRLLATRVAPRRLAALSVLALALLGGLTHWRAQLWPETLQNVLATAERKPDSLRAQVRAGELLGELAMTAEEEKIRKSMVERADSYFRRASIIKPDSPSAHFGWLFAYYYNGLAPPAEILSDLKDRLARGHIDTSTVNGIHALTGCIAKGICALPRESYLALIDAAYDNLDYSPANRNRVLRDLAQYQSRVAGNALLAAQVTKTASELLPQNLHTRLELALYLAQAGLLQEARAELEMVRAMDSLGRAENMASLIEQQVSELEDRTGTR